MMGDNRRSALALFTLAVVSLAILTLGSVNWAQASSASSKKTDPTASARLRKMVWLTRGGPVLIHWKHLHNGNSIRTNDALMTTQLFKMLDTDGDGKLSMAEARKKQQLLADAASVMRVPTVNANYYGLFARDNNRARFVLDKMDVNKDGFVSVAEFIYMARPRVPSYQFLSTTYVTGEDANQKVWAIINRNGDNELSEKELKMAGYYLRVRDVNRNGITDGNEMNPPASRSTPYAGGATPYRAPQPKKIDDGSFGVQSIADNDEQWPNALWLYADDHPMGPDWVHPELFAFLDANKDKKINRNEWQALLDGPATLEIIVDHAKGKFITKVAKKIKSDRLGAKVEDTQLTLTGASNRLVFNFQDMSSSTQARVNNMKTFLKRADADQSGKISQAEFSIVANRMRLQFKLDQMDFDLDGFVSTQELDFFFEFNTHWITRGTQLQFAQSPDPLLQVTDINNDGRLGQRDVRNFMKNLMTLDRNGDGKIQQEEVPTCASVSIAVAVSPTNRTTNRPAYNYANLQSRTYTRMKQDEPAWFNAMDQDGDGDISQDEFPGSAKRFAQIDTNHDGFITIAEANAFDEKNGVTRPKNNPVTEPVVPIDRPNVLAPKPSDDEKKMEKPDDKMKKPDEKMKKPDEKMEKPGEPKKATSKTT